MDAQKLGAILQGLAKDSSDPLVQGLVQVLTQALNGDDSDEDTEAERRRRAGRKKLRRLHQMLELMTERNALVASALGACPCWGGDDGCDECRGEGAPGCYEPDPAAFGKLVVPLFRARPHLGRALVESGPVAEKTAPTKPVGRADSIPDDAAAGQPTS